MSDYEMKISFKAQLKLVRRLLPSLYPLPLSLTLSPIYCSYLYLIKATIKQWIN